MKTKEKERTSPQPNTDNSSSPSLNIKDIYKELCPACRDRLLTMAAKTVASDSVRKQLKDDWEKAD